MPRQNAIAKRQSDALRLEALRRYFDFSNGRPTAAGIARAMDLPVDTVESWLPDPDNAQFLDEVVPLWPNLLIVQFPKRLMTSIDAVYCNGFTALSP